MPWEPREILKKELLCLLESFVPNYRSYYLVFNVG